MPPSRLRIALLVAAGMILNACTTARVASDHARPAFDYEEFRTVTVELGRFDPGGTVHGVSWSDDGSTLSFTRLDRPYEFDLLAGTLQPVVTDDESDDADDGDGRRRRRRGPARGRQRSRETSPDGAWAAIAEDWNVVLESTETDERTAVTTDGSRKLRYGQASWVYGEELDQRSAMWWSPDSRRLVFYAFDERDVPDFYLLNGLTEQYTKTMREGYPKPGDPNPRASLLVYDLETGQTTQLDTDGGGDEPDGTDETEEWYVYHVRFTADGSGLLFNRTNRHQNVLHVDLADPVTGRARTVVTETQTTWQTNRPAMRFLEDGVRFVWETERSGRRQFELRHLDGRRLATLTPADRLAIAVVRVDEEAGVIYYTAYGEDHPLHAHLYRVNLDGSGRRRLTREPANHSVQFSPHGRWFLTRYETITDPPTTALYDTDGHRIATLAASERERIETLGYPEPELFSFTADDGETTLFGWLHKPRGFDPARRYPLLIDVYGGPSSKGVRSRYRPAHAACAAGFLVAKIDNRGTAGRGKAFVGAVYQKLGIVDIEDQADGVRHLLRRPYVDADRVGIYGHSYGGYMSALAILKYPDLFQVAVAASPVTDWRNYDTIYTERYMRTPEENPEGYDEGSCLTYAENLRGKLLILHGMVDDNVHPTNAWQLVDALQQAGRPFEIMFYPKAGHGLGRHAARARWEFLYRHLIAEPRPPAPPVPSAVAEAGALRERPAIVR